LNRRFEEAIETFLDSQRDHGPSDAISSALAAAYRDLGLQTLANQVRRSVRSLRGNQWMFRVGHPADHALRIRRELLDRDERGMFPVLRESTPVRMDLSHSGWSDIFFLGMDFPEGARVLNVSIDLGVHGRDAAPKPPVEAYLRVIDSPVLRLTSVDLGATAEITDLAEVFDFARDYLGLLKAAVIAAGIVPPGIEGSGQSLAHGRRVRVHVHMTQVARDQALAAGLADDPGREGLAAMVMDELDRTRAVIDVAVAPVGQGQQHATQVLALGGQHILVAGRPRGIGAGLHHPVGDEGLEPRSQHVAGDAESLLPLLEAAHAKEGVPQDQDRPGIADDLQRPGDAAGLPGIVCCSAHGGRMWFPLRESNRVVILDVHVQLSTAVRYSKLAPRRTCPIRPDGAHDPSLNKEPRHVP
jgi:hypothetical protein